MLFLAGSQLALGSCDFSKGQGRALRDAGDRGALGVERGRGVRVRAGRTLARAPELAQAMNRREVVMAGVLAALPPVASRGQSRREFIDAAKRRVALPARVEESMRPARPPAYWYSRSLPTNSSGGLRPFAKPRVRSWRRNMSSFPR